MTFWGVEVKPGKSYSHSYDNARGRVRITQATLGNGKSNEKSTLQVNVGNKRPILICCLVPNVLETSRLELEFDEVEEVIFSVLGQKSIHLCGYFVGRSGPMLDGDDDTESYGEDIANTDSSRDHGGSDDEDEYDSDFIDDADIKVFSHVPRRKRNAVTEERTENDKPPKDDTNRRSLKRKHQVSDSDDDTQAKHVKPINSIINVDSEEEDDDDVLSMSFLSEKKTDIKDSDANLDLTSDKKDVYADHKENIDTESQADKFTRKGTETGHKNSEKLKKKNKKKKNKEKTTHVSTSIMEKEETEPLQNQITESYNHNNDGKTKEETTLEVPSVVEKARIELVQNFDLTSDEKEANENDKNKIDIISQADESLDLTSNEKEASEDDAKINDTMSQADKSLSKRTGVSQKNSEKSKKKKRKKNKEETTLASPSIVEKEETEPLQNQIAESVMINNDGKTKEEILLESPKITEKAKTEHDQNQIAGSDKNENDGRTKKKKKTKKGKNLEDTLTAADYDKIGQNPPASHEAEKLAIINSELVDSSVPSTKIGCSVVEKAKIEHVQSLDSISDAEDSFEDDENKIDTIFQVDKSLDFISNEMETIEDAPKINDTMSQADKSTSKGADTSQKNGEKPKKKKEKEITPSIVKKEETKPLRNQVTESDKNNNDGKTEEEIRLESCSIFKKAKTEHAENQIAGSDKNKNDGKTKKKKKTKKEKNSEDTLKAADNDNMDQNPPDYESGKLSVNCELVAPCAITHENCGKLKKKSRKKATEDRGAGAGAGGGAADVNQGEKIARKLTKTDTV